jgi:DTW domain-containing protein YfiP
MIAGVEVLHFGQRDPPFDEAALHRSGVEFFVLFPRDDAHVLADDRPLADQLEVSAENRPGLVVLDGTWHQCSRMSRRVPGVDRLPCVALPAGPPGIWSVRRQHDPRGLSTFEATMRLLALAEPSDALAPLNAAFERVTARMLFMKGKLASPEVPHDWSSSRSRAPLGTTDELG